MAKKKIHHTKKKLSSPWYKKLPIISSILASFMAILLAIVYVLLPKPHVLGTSLSNSVYVFLKSSTNKPYYAPKGVSFCLNLEDKLGNSISSGVHCYSSLSKRDLLVGSSIPTYVSASYSFVGSIPPEFHTITLKATSITYNGSCGNTFRNPCVITINVPDTTPHPTPTPANQKRCNSRFFCFY